LGAVTGELIAEVRAARDFGPIVLHPLVGGLPVDEAWKSVELFVDSDTRARLTARVRCAPGGYTRGNQLLSSIEEFT
jgi:hypothetical protein